ncbi:DUF3611 family protein [Thiohalocapsa marina]|uniref:DUF3611 family protein n=1 Tax=Thiohalocapsa marina TaxID=424902 RepID=A0A5M8FSH8_9GAMM|nr:DUF3611 family protein [Thiohalocapsa marina]KAA6186715.1 DUF3611 family protein [Thiohalocapsa marina]
MNSGFVASCQWPPANPERLAARFSRLGWIGLYVQLALLTVPVLLAVYVLFFATPDSAARKGVDLSNYLSFGSLLVAVFTAYWFFHYTRVAKRIADPASIPPLTSLVKTVWIGIWAGSIGIFFSMLLLFGAAWRMLFILLANPQTGIMVAPAIGGSPAQAISAIDGVSLTSLLIMLAVELLVLGLSLWLLYQTTRPTPEKAKA